MDKKGMCAFLLLGVTIMVQGFHLQGHDGVRRAVCRGVAPCCAGHVCRAYQRFDASRPVAACAVSSTSRPLYAPGSSAQQRFCRPIGGQMPPNPMDPRNPMDSRNPMDPRAMRSPTRRPPPPQMRDRSPNFMGRGGVSMSQGDDGISINSRFTARQGPPQSFNDNNRLPGFPPMPRFEDSFNQGSSGFDSDFGFNRGSNEFGRQQSPSSPWGSNTRQPSTRDFPPPSPRSGFGESSRSSFPGSMPRQPFSPGNEGQSFFGQPSSPFSQNPSDPFTMPGSQGFSGGMASFPRPDPSMSMSSSGFGPSSSGRPMLESSQFGQQRGSASRQFPLQSDPFPQGGPSPFMPGGQGQGFMPGDTSSRFPPMDSSMGGSPAFPDMTSFTDQRGQFSGQPQAMPMDNQFQPPGSMQMPGGPQGGPSFPSGQPSSPQSGSMSGFQSLGAGFDTAMSGQQGFNGQPSFDSQGFGSSSPDTQSFISQLTPSAGPHGFDFGSQQSPSSGPHGFDFGSQQSPSSGSQGFDFTSQHSSSSGPQGFDFTSQQSFDLTGSSSGSPSFDSQPMGPMMGPDSGPSSANDGFSLQFSNNPGLSGGMPMPFRTEQVPTSVSQLNNNGQVNGNSNNNNSQGTTG